MDIERIDWWEKEKPPFIWINFKQWEFFQKFKNGNFTQDEWEYEIQRIRFRENGPEEK